MRSHQEANDSVTIEQEQADQVRRTVGATLATVLADTFPKYQPSEHARAAARLAEHLGKCSLCNQLLRAASKGNAGGVEAPPGV